MGIINIYLKDSGSIAKLQKDFPLYKGQYQSNKIDIYVPITLLPSTENHIASVKTAMIITKPNGDKTTTTSYNAPIKTGSESVVVDGVTYCVYEQDLPQRFTSESGDQTIIANVIEIDNTDPENPTTVRIITSQTAILPIQDSDYIDNEEVEDPSQLEYVTALLNEKQDKVDPNIIANGTLTTTSVVTSINELNAQVTQNTQAINGTDETDGILDRLTTAEGDIDDIQAEQVTQNHDISQNATDIDTLEGKVANLEDIVGSGEDYVGTYPMPSETSSLDPNNPMELETLKGRLTSFVRGLRGRVQGGDVVIYIQTLLTDTDRNYKFIYSGYLNDWTFFEIPPMEKASNFAYGIIKGNQYDLTQNTTVNIQDGVVKDILVKDKDIINRKSLASYIYELDSQIDTNTGNITTLQATVGSHTSSIGTLNTQMTGILNGTTTVPVADKATKDGLGNNIVNTYMTQNAGVTKTQLKEYALPRAFNDVSFIGEDNVMVDVVPSSASPIYTATSTSVGDTRLFRVQKTIGNVEYQLASKNSYSDTVFVSASENCDVQYRLSTSIYTNDEWTVANVELTDTISMVANEIKKISFGSTMNYLALLGELILNIQEDDIIQQTLEVITTTSQSTTFDVYSNETYPSTFYLNTTAQTIVTQSGDLGEIPVYSASGTVDNNTLTFALPTGTIINENTNCLFKLNYSGSLTGVTAVNLEYNNSAVKIVVPPYNKTTLTDVAPSDLEGVYTSGVGYEFEGLIQKISSDYVVYATIGGGSVTAITTTSGSESISDGTNTIEPVTRNTTQTITAPKTIDTDADAPDTKAFEVTTEYADTDTGMTISNDTSVNPTSAVSTITSQLDADTQFESTLANTYEGIAQHLEYTSTSGGTTTTTVAQCLVGTGIYITHTVTEDDGNTTNTTTHTIEVSDNGILIDGNALGNQAFKTITEETISISTNSWHALTSGSDVYKYMATITPTYVIGNDTEVSIINNSALLFAEYGFAIGTISGTNIDLYATKQPNSTMNLTFSFKD